MTNLPRTKNRPDRKSIGKSSHKDIPKDSGKAASSGLSDIPPGVPEIPGDVPEDVGAVLTIDLGAVAANYAIMRKLSGKANCAAVVKANAYGLGDREIVRTLVKQGCNTLFVANLKEAIRARRTSRKPDIYVLDGFHPERGPDYLKHKLRPVLNNLAEIRTWNGFAKAENVPAPAAIQLDTGMNRLGLPEYEISALAQNPDDLRHFECALVMSHLACADDPTHPMSAWQKKLFDRYRELLPDAQLSLANSAGIACGKQYHYDMTRPGIALYGGEPCNGISLGLKPVISLMGRILQVHTAETGESVGYGATHTFTRKSRIATVSLGYADGILRILGSSLAKSAPRGRYGAHDLPLIGRISMDLITYDLTDMEAGQCRPGDWIEIIGPTNDINRLADCARTNSYEILTSLGSRPHRIYKRIG